MFIICKLFKQCLVPLFTWITSCLGAYIKNMRFSSWSHSVERSYLFSTFFFLLSLVSSYFSFYSFYHLYECFQFWMFRSYLEIYSDFIYIGNSMLLTLSLLCPSKWTDAELLNIFKKFEFLLVLCAIFALSECFRSIESECNAASCPHLELQILATTKNCSLVHF